MDKRSDNILQEINLEYSALSFINEYVGQDILVDRQKELLHDIMLEQRETM
jgi:hypothetical protein